MRLDATTLIFETINFVVLALVLWRILYRPLRRAMEERRSAIEEDRQRAEAAHAEARRLEAEWRHKHEELEDLRASVRAEVLDAAERERAVMLERARDDAHAELARVRQLSEAEREAAERWVESAVVERGADLAGRLLLELAPEAVDGALAERLVGALEARRGELSALSGETSVEVELTGARLPEPGLAERIAAVLREALARPIRIVTRGDPSLVGGWTVRVGDRLFDASIAGELAAFRGLARELLEETRG
ncbi:MAG: F0F1 ATP synthase subunit delta [Sandaracinaceae bacterium]|nr:F0F1 ATP synthase subunit delta [Sandaracinaceae bacterium]